MPNPIQPIERTNWAGNYSYTATTLHEPASAEEVQRLVRETTGPLKALGSRHSFSPIADTPGAQVSPREAERDHNQS